MHRTNQCQLHRDKDLSYMFTLLKKRKYKHNIVYFRVIMHIITQYENQVYLISKEKQAFKRRESDYKWRKSRKGSCFNLRSFSLRDS